jgi:aminopeptidase N
MRDGTTAIVLDAEKLSVDGVWEKDAPLRYEQAQDHLTVQLARPALTGQELALKVTYRGRPVRGLRFFPREMYTAFATRAWMICHDEPYDRATFTLRLTIPRWMKVVGNGKRITQNPASATEEQSVWRQDTPVPTYTFGFAAGDFDESTTLHNGIGLVTLSTGYSAKQVKEIFGSTADILDYFSGKAGVPYAGDRYTQVLATGSVEQEMSGFTVLRATYGRDVLSDSRNIWLIAHELAHQWWGNGLTCSDWSDFWLNEGVASFMADAYLEHAFGEHEYERQMVLAQRIYDRARSAGKDRPLVFYHGSEPQDMSGPITYQKGALVLDSLRSILGDNAFWDGIRRYTQEHFGKNVVSKDLQSAFGEASGKDLSDFFARYVYGTESPIRHSRSGTSRNPDPIRSYFRSLPLSQSDHKSPPTRGCQRSISITCGGQALSYSAIHMAPILVVAPGNRPAMACIGHSPGRCSCLRHREVS